MMEGSNVFCFYFGYPVQIFATLTVALLGTFSIPGHFDPQTVTFENRNNRVIGGYVIWLTFDHSLARLLPTKYCLPVSTAMPCYLGGIS